MRQTLCYFIGYFFSVAYNLFCSYKERKINRLLGGGCRFVYYPYHIQGIQNIIAEDNISIGIGSTIYTTKAKVYIRNHFVSGPNLTIISGDHMPIVGRFIDTINECDKEKLDVAHEYDKDIVIEEDVWCGANVTVLKNVTIGRGSIVAAGSVVTKSIPPYSIAAGVPARPIKMRWSIDQILEHERTLYPEPKRLSKSRLNSLFGNSSLV